VEYKPLCAKDLKKSLKKVKILLDKVKLFVILPIDKLGGALKDDYIFASKKIS
jgi:hypothetical protein